ncbi:MAG: chemotaxis protein CheB [Sphingomonas sp.]
MHSSSLRIADAPPRVRDVPRILIVDDSVVARAVIARAVEATGRFAVAGTVPNARSALCFLETHRVDGIILDIHMPGIDGLTALPDLIATGRGAKVLIVSSTCGEGAQATIEALALGAADTLEKPGAGGLAGNFSAAVGEKLTRLFEADPVTSAVVTPVTGQAAGSFDIVGIGASTGGIHALSLLLREIPAGFPLPILITQHLPASFMPYFAAQVSVLAARPCEVATDLQRIRPGRVYIAPGDAHLRVMISGEGTAVRLSREPSKSGCLPSVDPMFESLAEVYGARAIGVVLSGMGRDGASGAERIRERGGSLAVQDKDSSVVWGMPGAIAANGLAGAILPPAEIGKLLAARRRPGC